MFMKDVEGKRWLKIRYIAVPIIAAIITCVGAVVAAIIEKIPVSTIFANKTPVIIVVTESESSVVASPTSALLVVPTGISTSPIQATLTIAALTPQPLSCNNALRKVQSYQVGQLISGPATLHPLDGCTEMGTQLGLVCVGHWGINVPAGKTVVIPQAIVLFSGNSILPNGTFSSYESDSQLQTTQDFWLANCVE